MRTIWYMGIKTRLTGAIREAVAERVPRGGAVLDLMSGSCAVGHSLAGSYRVYANDVQAYAAAIARGYLEPLAGRRSLAAQLDFERDLGPAYRANRAALWGWLAEGIV